LLRANVWVFMLILSHPLALCSDFVGRAPLPDAGASPMLPRPDVDRFFDVASGGPPFSLSMTVTRILPGATREGVWDFTIQVGVSPLCAGCHPSAGHMLCVRPIPPPLCPCTQGSDTSVCAGGLVHGVPCVGYVLQEPTCVHATHTCLRVATCCFFSCGVDSPAPQLPTLYPDRSTPGNVNMAYIKPILDANTYELPACCLPALLYPHGALHCV
jgi:hypothetical protein